MLHIASMEVYFPKRGFFAILTVGVGGICHWDDTTPLNSCKFVHMFVFDRETWNEWFNCLSMRNWSLVLNHAPPSSKDPTCLVWQLSFHRLPACCTLLLNLATRGDQHDGEIEDIEDIPRIGCQFLYTQTFPQVQLSNTMQMLVYPCKEYEV